MTGAILVGGRARRLGGAVKPSLRIGGARILDRQLTALREAGVCQIVLVGHWPEPQVTGVHHVPDLVEGAGALGGLYSALLAAPTEVVLVFAGDMPFVTPAWITMLAAMGSSDAKVPCVGGRWHPLCAGYRRRAATAIKRRIDQGTLRVTDALTDLVVHQVDATEIAQFDTTGMLLMNVNTPDDYREAERLAR